MSRPGNVARFNYSGNLPGGERFVFGLWGLYSTPPANQVDFQSDVAILASDTSGNLNGIAVQCLPTSCKIDTVTGYFYGNAGSNKATLQAQSTCAKQGSSTLIYPNQLALCVTTRTGRPGRSYRGRIYLPWLVKAVDTTTGQMTTAGLSAISTSVGGLIHDIKQLVGKAVVVSDAQSVASEIVDIKIDTKLDTQRRRAKSDVPTGNVVTTIGA